ncbi:hypothetical protein DdX_17227 [Ditylenchus destructor]|uniref:Uncharacterized protein n=1 Tax=Ditylenchus destructor TaxID=166010 RepID=A0AAD4MRV0_9BILA|nr:hypothetical protein DdX_17227 [Ditylenchus destructor]
MIVIEEDTHGHIANVYGNYYTRSVFMPITNARTSPKGKVPLNIAIVVVIEGNSDDYELAIRTVQCYSMYHSYPFFLMNLSTNITLSKACSQDDFMFRRHCALATLLQDNPHVDYALFIDADMAVINPNHLLEEYIARHTAGNLDLIFSDRIFTNEIMAGSYFAKNTEYSRNFLLDWANYFYNLPNSFHGTDNGAIHSLFLDRFCRDCENHWVKLCKRLWHTSQDYNGLSLYTSCVRYVLGDRSLLKDVRGGGQIIILIEYVDFWVRDGWLTENQWSGRDFLLHGWQKRRRDKVVFGRWHSPLVINDQSNDTSIFDEGRCTPGNSNAYLNWPYKDTFIKSDDFISRLISQKFLRARDKYASELETLLHYGLPP